METNGLYYIGDDTWEDDPGHQFHTQLSKFLTTRDQLIYSEKNIPFTPEKLLVLDTMLEYQAKEQVYLNTLKAYIRINGHWAKEFHYFVDDGGEGYLFNSQEIEPDSIIRYIYDQISGFELDKKEQRRSYRSGYKCGFIHNVLTKQSILIHLFSCHISELNFVTTEPKLFIKDYVWVCYAQDLSDFLIDKEDGSLDDEEFINLVKYTHCIVNEDFASAEAIMLDCALEEKLREAGDYYLGLLKNMYGRLYRNELNPAFLLSKIGSDKQYVQ